MSALPAPDFRPLPLLGNPHVQTVLGAFLQWETCPAPQRRHTVWLPDGDGLLLHENTPAGWLPGQPAALLLHGLTGCHNSPHVQRLAVLLLRRRVRVFRMDLRSAGEGVSLARNTYHAGRSEDVRTALARVGELCRGSPLLLLGVSLGGNIALKLAGESAERRVPGLAGVGALAPPIDLIRCCELLAQPRNRVYEQRFVRDLARLARRRQYFFPDLPPVRFPNLLTIRQFDDLYTAPRSGFADALDYYRRASSLSLIPQIPVPTLILTARDDPFIAVEPFEGLRTPEHIHTCILPWGGHVGFVGWDGNGGIRWAERRVVDWLLREVE